MAQIEKQNREELVRGHFILLEENSSLWSVGYPDDPDDIPSVVCLGLPLEKYTAQELMKLIEISKRINAEYERLLEFKKGSNLWYLNKSVWEFDPWFD